MAESQPPDDAVKQEHVDSTSDSGSPSSADRPLKLTRGERIRLALLRIVAVVAVLFLLAVLGVGAAGWYTSRSEFCKSCHIMEPYYASWEKSSHSDVACIKCHFPPGVGEKVRGKLLGLVQLTKYVTSTAGPRPAAEVPDASCLRSGCHETRLLAGRVDFKGVPFDHQPHLEKVRRGKQLRCTSCHSQIVQGDHMTVTETTCFLCHFKDNPFNEGLGACTHCHQIPERKFELGGGFKFDHELAYEKGVACANCHSDLIRGNGEVPVERCTVCHNREDDLKRLDEHEFLHQVHVAEHYVDCMSCHLSIEHKKDPQMIVHAADNCASCHQQPHRSQVDMLLGRGGKTYRDHPSGMIEARVSCATCHKAEVDAGGETSLMQASLHICTTCHNQDKIDQFAAYNEQLDKVVKELSASVDRIDAALKTKTLDEPAKEKAGQRLNNARSDLKFLQVANGIHNLHYATTLTREVLAALSELSGEVGVDAPKVTLPELPENSDAAAEVP